MYSRVTHTHLGATGGVWPPCEETARMAERQAAQPEGSVVGSVALVRPPIGVVMDVGVLTLRGA